MVNAKWWASLDPELQEIIQTAAVEGAEKNRVAAEEAANQALEDLRGLGVDVHVQTPEEIEAWSKAAQPVWDQFAGQIGEELIDALKSYQQ